MQFVADLRRLLQREGDSALDEVSAARLWGAIFDGSLDQLEIGAVMAALIVAGESREELLGLHRAAAERLVHWSPPGLATRAVAIPAYGLVPGEALIVTMTAALLRRFEIPVIIHGVLDSRCGVSSASVLRALGVLPCANFAQAVEQLRNAGVAFLPVQLFCPAFAALLALRARLGVENSAHLVAQALDPAHGGATRLRFSVAGTRSERFETLGLVVEGDFLTLTWPAGRSPLNLTIRPRIERVCDGARELLFEADVWEMPSASAPPTDDAHSVAQWIERVVGGASAAPVPAVNLVAACLYAVGRAPDFSQAKAMASLRAGRLAA